MNKIFIVCILAMGCSKGTSASTDRDLAAKDAFWSDKKLSCASSGSDSYGVWRSYNFRFTGFKMIGILDRVMDLGQNTVYKDTYELQCVLESNSGATYLKCEEKDSDRIAIAKLSRNALDEVSAYFEVSNPYGNTYAIGRANCELEE